MEVEEGEEDERPALRQATATPQHHHHHHHHHPHAQVKEREREREREGGGTHSDITTPPPARSTGRFAPARALTAASSEVELPWPRSGTLGTGMLGVWSL